MRLIEQKQPLTDAELELKLQNNINFSQKCASAFKYFSAGLMAYDAIWLTKSLELGVGNTLLNTVALASSALLFAVSLGWEKQTQFDRRSFALVRATKKAILKKEEEERTK